jgi:putative tricarboxylic transport membrane protein
MMKAREERVGDVLLGVGVIIGAAVYLYADANLPVLQNGGPMGPQAFPALVGIGLLASGLLLLGETWRRRRAAGIAAAIPTDPIERRSRRILAAMTAWTALYYFAFERAGYLVATAVYMFALLAFFNRGRWWVNAASAAGFTLVAYLLFTAFLQVVLPRGILDF